MRTVFLLWLLVSICYSYKFLVYSPLFAHSHNTFMGMLADTLTEAGHDVTVFLPVLDVNLTKKSGVKKTKKTIFLDADPRVDHFMKTTKLFSNMWTISNTPLGLLSMIEDMSRTFGYACEHILKQDKLFEQLREEKFDVAIVEPFYYCGFGIMEHIGIKKVISAFSGTNTELISYLIGEPSVPSYVPTISCPSDRLSISQKLGNALGGFVGYYMFNTIATVEGKYLTAKFGDKYSGHAELVGRSSFSILNANPYIDFPRPVLHKTVQVGGIAVDVSNVEKVDKEWDKILSERSQTVLISFGSVAKSKDMPENYKQQILKVIASLPNTTFIWKYEEPTKMGEGLDNLHFSTWVPQKPLLADSRLTLFITHGGLGSTTEVAYLGKPAIFIPIFADQPRNAAMLARHKGSIVLKKEDLSDAENIQKAITAILNDKSYTENANHLGEMLRNPPENPKRIFLKHAEFAARFGPLTLLDPYGRQLSFIQYYLIDVAATVLVVLALLLFVFQLLFRKYCCSGKKQKKD